MNRIPLTTIAKAMLNEAQLLGCPGAYVATGYSSDNISILHQQVRAANLSWALMKLRKVKHGSVVGIVGGGFSGIMTAVSLAVQRRCIVYIFEKNEWLLERFRNSHSRFISTNLNSRDLPPRFDPSYSAPIYKSPIFQWSEGAASEVAHRWLREFQTYYTHLPIFLITKAEILGCSPHTNGGVKLELKGRRGSIVEQAVDLAVFSVGFGNEQNRLSIQDWSYWNSGSPLQYRPGLRTAKKERVLISGCGDSGVVELMHYVFRDFEHREINKFYPMDCGIESYVQPMLEQSNFWRIRYSNEIEQFDRKLISELCWFFTRKYLVEANPHFENEVMKRLSGGARRVEVLYRGVYEQVSALLGKHLKTRISPYSSAKDVERFRAVLERLPPSTQFSIRNELRPWVSELASVELDLNMRGVNPTNFFSLEEYKRRRLGRFEIWMNDVTPSMYTDKLSPANLIFLRLCQSVEDVRFVSGQLKRVCAKNGSHHVKFENGRRMIFERVASRYGTAHGEATQKVMGVAPRKMHFGDWLLEIPESIDSSDLDETGTGTIRRQDAAFSAIAEATRKAVREARFVTGAPALSKLVYISALWLSGTKQQVDDPIYSDPERWLRQRVKRGAFVNYLHSDGREL
jgi:hypothetical protein